MLNGHPIIESLWESAGIYHISDNECVNVSDTGLGLTRMFTYGRAVSSLLASDPGNMITKYWWFRVRAAGEEDEPEQQALTLASSAERG